MVRTAFSILAALTLSLTASSADPSAVRPDSGPGEPVILENEVFLLVLSADGCAESLILKSSGEECLCPGVKEPFFSVTQERPFNNEIKLAHPNKRTTYYANGIKAQPTAEGKRITVSFSLAPYEAIVDVRIAPRYMAFSLSGFSVPPEGYPGLRMATPPVAEFRMISLPVRDRTRFGEWLNVGWDDETAVSVLAAEPSARIEGRHDRGYTVLSADAVREIRLEGATAALIASRTEEFLDAVDVLEKDYGLPLGVESRRSPEINASVYWTSDCTPENVDEHIRYAKQGGFRLMLLYYTSLFKERGSYSLNGNYDWRDEYPNGKDDATRMLDKIREAGIIPGFHFLHTHIGLDSRYCTPDADPRLNKTCRFTLSKPLGKEDTVIEVEERPVGCDTDPKCRILQFGGELISYESFTTERPYRFSGCVRGHRGTTPRSHPRGEVGGLLDVSEFGAGSCYLDQETSLQDEIAAKLADAWTAGFRFCYFDGSEGTDAPYEYEIPLAQYRVWKRFEPSPILAEGAAKAHFSWHLLSGGNAFDIFPPAIFKEMIRRYPAEEAPRMREDFTRLNFGWWGLWLPEGRTDGGTQADLIEYGTSRAAAWDCPVTVQTRLSIFRTHPRTRDILEVFRRWEDVRAKGWLTKEQKEELKDLDQEHILLLNSSGGYELTPYEQIPTADSRVRAFIFQRGGKSVVVFWHTEGNGTLRLPLKHKVRLSREIDRGNIRFRTETGKEALLLPVGDRSYLTTDADPSLIRDAFASCSLL